LRGTRNAGGGGTNLQGSLLFSDFLETEGGGRELWAKALGGARFKSGQRLSEPEVLGYRESG